MPIIPGMTELIWVQEEPENMGAYFYVKEKLKNLLLTMNLSHVEFRCVAREKRSSPATGSPQKHVEEQQLIIENTFNPQTLGVLRDTY